MTAAARNDYSHLTTAQKAELLSLADKMESAKQIPGGTAFVTDLLLAAAIKAGMTVVETARYDGLFNALKPFAEAFRAKTDPGDSDLDNEQPYHLMVTLGDCRRALSATYRKAGK